ncbi:MAG TPA: hypothetical protein VM686_16635 [Polyangiaceae bacterium]|jgi:hypothetical protein|nr:hypothetical protein [Polyangiaceae bacterium]
MKSAFVLKLPDGRGLVDMLAEAAGDVRGWVQASGVVEEVELRVAGEGADHRRTLRGRFALVSLSGPTGGPYTVQLAWAARGGFELAAGELVSARTAGVRGLLIPAQILGEEPDFEDAAPPALEAAKASSAPASSWAAQAAAVASAHAEPEDEEPETPDRGDLVHHFAFGWCEVIMVNGERLKLRDLKGPGRIREIIIDVLDVAGPSEKDGKRAFKLTRRQ